jgi:hypothetical protein
MAVLRKLRVIDVHSICLVDMPTDCIYLALSYVWGQEKQSRLSMDFLAAWKIPGSLENAKLIRTMVEALSLTRKLGYQYLWIDSICIVHESQEDLTHQIQQMYRIYDHAYLTIIVASGKGCGDGIPSFRPGDPRIPFQACSSVNGAEYGWIYNPACKLLESSAWN